MKVLLGLIVGYTAVVLITAKERDAKTREVLNACVGENK